MTITITRRSSVHLLPGLAIEEEARRVAEAAAAHQTHLLHVRMLAWQRLHHGFVPYGVEQERWDDAARGAGA